MPPQKAVTWEQSGNGECDITLQDAQNLAIAGGFIFKGAEDARLPLARRADLQAMFEHCGVNSLSSFRQKFWSYELRPEAAGSKAPATMAPCPAAGSRSRWQVQVQVQGAEIYVGEMLNGRRHGSGILLCKGERSTLLYVGQFLEGKRNGPGVVASTRGELFEGHFRDDILWGPGVYDFPLPNLHTYPPPPRMLPRQPSAEPQQQQQQPEAAASNACASGSDSGSAGKNVEPDAAESCSGPASSGSASSTPSQQAPYRVRFSGMMNGRPQGKGCLTWSDGSQQLGQFDGNNCYMRQQQPEVAGVLMVAADNARAAREAAAAARMQALRQQHHVAEKARQLFAAVPLPAEGSQQD